MKFLREKAIARSLSLLLLFVFIAVLNPEPVLAAVPYELLQNQTVGGIKMNYVRIDMNQSAIHPVQISANGNMTSTASVADMAAEAGAFAAVNGTYFEAYNGVPIPWGTLIRDGKLLHTGGGAVVGFTEQGRLLVDRVSFSFSGYVNGLERSIPWRINHPSEEPDAITIFTPEYGAAVSVASGGKAVLVSGGAVTQISDSDFWTPGDGFAILYGPATAYLVSERFGIGAAVTYTSRISTTFTDPKDWDGVKVAVGAGPSLIINGQVTADGAAEGFTEAKVNTNRSAHSFIGATEDGQVVVGNMPAATLAEAAAACQELGLVNAMCLDGGGSVGLAFEGKSISAGRNVNNALGFVADAALDVSAADASDAVPVEEPLAVNAVSALAGSQKLSVAGAEAVTIQSYNINGNNFFKLRDVAFILKDTSCAFSVGWDEATAAISLRNGETYQPTGAELEQTTAGSRAVLPSTANLLVNGEAKFFTVYNIDGNNYFKLRDFEMLGVNVGWDEAAGVILLSQTV
ncbi:MAG: phosphodiester glycosidase family protein [Peptococcaceae bacterium]|jgi:hypothetical protein|nr:phosphodiester glycosidase family protein [Peptococcaceae bacterium]